MKLRILRIDIILLSHNTPFAYPLLPLGLLSSEAIHKALIDSSSTILRADTKQILLTESLYIVFIKHS
jgi:hypothetical protein